MNLFDPRFVLAKLVQEIGTKPLTRPLSRKELKVFGYVQRLLTEDLEVEEEETFLRFTMLSVLERRPPRNDDSYDDDEIQRAPNNISTTPVRKNNGNSSNEIEMDRVVASPPTPDNRRRCPGLSAQNGGTFGPDEDDGFQRAIEASLAETTRNKQPGTSFAMNTVVASLPTPVDPRRSNESEMDRVVASPPTPDNPRRGLALAAQQRAAARTRRPVWNASASSSAVGNSSTSNAAKARNIQSKCSSRNDDSYDDDEIRRATEASLVEATRKKELNASTESANKGVGSTTIPTSPAAQPSTSELTAPNNISTTPVRKNNRNSSNASKMDRVVASPPTPDNRRRRPALSAQNGVAAKPRRPDWKAFVSSSAVGNSSTSNAAKARNIQPKCSPRIDESYDDDEIRRATEASLVEATRKKELNASTESANKGVGSTTILTSPAAQPSTSDVTAPNNITTTPARKNNGNSSNESEMGRVVASAPTPDNPRRGLALSAANGVAAGTWRPDSNASASSSAIGSSSTPNPGENTANAGNIQPMPPPFQLGLPNLGNTCYMNAVVQALAASESLANFFLNSEHTKTMQDRTREQELNSQLHGSNGAVTEAFATLVNKLYNNKCLKQDARDFRAVVGDYSPDYKTYKQQDAQEFLNWLLDKVHEDLNLAKKDDNCNYSKNGENFSPDEALAERRLAHDSVITNLFEGQLRSSIVCQSCHFQKFNFEPYMYVSLPIPHHINQKRLLFIFFVKPGQFLMTKYGIPVDAKEAISDLKSYLAEETKLPLSRILVLQLSPKGFQNNTPEVCQIATMSTREAYAIELQPTIDTYDDQTVNVVFVITVKNGPQVKRETDPFVLTVSRQWDYDTLSRKLFQAARQSVDPKVLESLPVGQYKLALIDTCNPSADLDPTASMPLLTQDVDQCIQHNNQDHPKLPNFIRIAVEFPQLNRSLIRVDLDRIINHRSADCLAKDNAPYELTLQSCLNAYTSEEMLEWRCERCSGRKANKQLKFNSCPQILILHLKRFRHSQNEITEPIKVDVSVKFPIEGLDMSPFVSPSNPQNGKLDSIIGEKSNKEMQATVSHSFPDDNIYDLFAVVNHTGVCVWSGHYTATVKNPTDGIWRTFDDTFVSQNTNPTKRSENAYLMFYERRSCRAERQKSKKAAEERDLPNPWARFTSPREKEMFMDLFDPKFVLAKLVQEIGMKPLARSLSRKELKVFGYVQRLLTEDLEVEEEETFLRFTMLSVLEKRPPRNDDITLDDTDDDDEIQRAPNNISATSFRKNNGNSSNMNSVVASPPTPDNPRRRPALSAQNRVAARMLRPDFCSSSSSSASSSPSSLSSPSSASSSAFGSSRTPNPGGNAGNARNIQPVFAARPRRPDWKAFVSSSAVGNSSTSNAAKARNIQPDIKFATVDTPARSRALSAQNGVTAKPRRPDWSAFASSSAVGNSSTSNAAKARNIQPTNSSNYACPTFSSSLRSSSSRFRTHIDHQKASTHIKGIAK
ncbi:unnamed protein product, partial [Mesorhabditis belari]|uniref:ubiquitinyl hydrolase 1 n=1 Tax=Mesorhabditis belari TaxID=2138241 RepID=A0AAF3F5T5_9BILA